MGVTAGGVVDRDMQLEILAVDAQFGEFIGGNEQMQRWLFVAEVVTDQLREEVLTVATQCQLQCPLQIALVFKVQRFQATQAAHQPLIDRHMVAAHITAAQFFQVGPDQPVVAWVCPMPQGTVQPRTIHRLGRCHLLQEP